MATGLVNPATGQIARRKMALDVERCIGCHACSVACKVENKVPLGRFRTKVYYYDQGKFPKVTRNFLPTLCMQCEDTPFDKIANHAKYTFWYVLPTLPMFLAFPALLARIGFWPTLLACVAISVICFAVLALARRRFGIHLL